MIETNKLLEQLNDSQREAVLYCDGASLVIAGAGSGKTRVLTYKIAYLLSLGYNPWNILALTFTNKAAREMKERVVRLVGQDARRLRMGTFHSIFSQILRSEAEHIGYQRNFTIYDQNDSRSLVKTIIKEMQLDDKTYKASSIADRISMAKNHLLLPAAYANSADTISYDNECRRPATKDIYARYVERCRQANAMDFDDLLVNTHELFAAHDDIRRRYAELFRFVLVDEYQDTNYVQQAIVMQLTREHQHVCVVGDDAQSIYSFRGANIDNILNFTSFYHDAKLFKLEQNYRSTQMIVQAANSLIRHNERQIPKDVFSKNEHGERVVLKPTYSDKEEAIVVCKDIQRIMREDHCQYDDFAILYRTNSQSRSFEECMLKENIPYRIYGGMSFYQRKEIKDIIAYFRLVCNPDDEEAFKRIINYPTRGIGNTTLTKIIDGANRYGVSLMQVIAQPDLYPIDVSKATANKLGAFCQMVSAWSAEVGTTDGYTLGHDIIAQSGVSKDIYSSREPEYLSRQENLEEFLSGLQDFVESRKEEDMGDKISLADFLQEVSLMSDLDSDDDEEGSKVTLMTVHSAKGLEFPTVFVVGLEENIFPSPMSSNSMRELEEERRLLYVAITRAEKHCILTCAQNRFRYGRMEYDTPSRFLKDIDPALLQIEAETKNASSDYDGRPRRYGYDSERPEWMQNPRPVASQFKADPMPRAVPHRSEPNPESPFSPSFQQALQQAKTNVSSRFKPVSRIAPSGIPSAGGGSDASSLAEGITIEHQRFGVGTVIKIEGEGENKKATVKFRNTGTKQLLLKFARYRIIE